MHSDAPCKEDINDLIDKLELEIDHVCVDNNPFKVLFNIIIAINNKRDEQLLDLVEDVIYAIDSGVPTEDLRHQLSKIGSK